MASAQNQSLANQRENPGHWRTIDAGNPGPNRVASDWTKFNTAKREAAFHRMQETGRGAPGSTDAVHHRSEIGWMRRLLRRVLG